MDLMAIIRDNPNARKAIIEMNLAVIAKKFGICFSDARKVQHYAFLLEAAE